jgi:nucleoside-diphosphate-sugar epimerase
MRQKIIITGGAGYIGSMLTGYLLGLGNHVTVVDKLLFGGDHMLCYELFTGRFELICSDILEADLVPIFDGANVVIHLAALVGFPACQQVGDRAARRYNVEGTKRVFDAANKCGVSRFIFSSTYSNYGASPDGQPVTEESPLNPQSLYAETKIEAEEFLLGSKTWCKPLVFRFSTLFGISPRTRFDLIINQFVLEAIKNKQITIYQKDYRRSFCHISDIARCVCGAIDWDLDSYGQVWNVGSNELNLSKKQVLDLINEQIPIEIIYKDLTFGGDMRDITVSFDKIKTAHDFTPRVSVKNGIAEIKDAINYGIIKNPMDEKYRNAKFIVS